MGPHAWIWVTAAPDGLASDHNDDGKLSENLDANPRIGFLAFANALTAQIAAGKDSRRQARGNPAAHLQPTLGRGGYRDPRANGDRAHCRGVRAVVRHSEQQARAASP